MNQVIKFSADWCGPCKAMKPHFEKFKAEFEEEIDLFDINVDEDPETAQAYNVRSIPTTVFFKEGKVVSRSVGLMTYEKLKEEAEKLLK